MTPRSARSRCRSRGRRARRVAGPARAAAAATLLLLSAPVGAAAEDGAAPACQEDDGGLSLAPGWCAALFAEGLGAVRNLAVAPDGTVYAARKDEGAPAGVALRDDEGDGRADRRETFGPSGPAHDVQVRDGRVWLATDTRILRFARGPGALAPAGGGEAVVEGFPAQGQHARKALALHDDALFVNVGAPSNACQRKARTPRSPGLDPCPQREAHAGIWRFSAGPTGQSPADGARFATGLRHTLALAVHPTTGQLFGAVNGRDQLHTLWGFSVEDNARLPAEELVAIDEGDDFGWPYCYPDAEGRKVLAPEYGGDGGTVGRCAEAELPALALPAHWAPMDLAFDGPDTAYLAFRGSWNRAPLPQEGYRVVRIPFADGRPTGRFETFAIGAESETELRFTGVAVGPEGAVYVAAENEGRIWRAVRRDPGEGAAP